MSIEIHTDDVRHWDMGDTRALSEVLHEMRDQMRAIQAELAEIKATGK